ncbi:GIY-YIG nuclease family protein [Pseudooctadecabacter sp.]|uniref:GIY-YIG nuclease family protein n=1 Tax=Pseudooctadecabacter sp. TaxID=1966338 RepID=UPI0035C7A1FA
MSAARSLELFFIDGRPDGMLTAQVFNWTGHVLRIPRTRLKEGLAREEAKFTGVYLLMGETSDGPLAYVGEAEDMAARLRTHAASKDWWDTAVLITTSADNLHKAHVRYLEARLVTIARDVALTTLENGNQPSGASLSEADRANMESYLETLMMVLPAIRVDNFLLKKRETSTVQHSETTEVRFECVVPRYDVHAFAVLKEGEMIVQAGSKVRPTWVGDRTYNTHYWTLFDTLVSKGIIADGLFTEDYAFSSPSATAAVVSGRSSNGRKAWKVAGSDQSYADWEDMQLTQVAT